jgi:endonuclease YncB( thermonuclease family)
MSFVNPAYNIFTNFVQVVVADSFQAQTQTCRVSPVSDPVMVMQSGRVETVIDGDSFKLSNGDSIRLFGINTTEKGEVGSANATEALTALIGHKRIHYKVHKTDSYGRQVASVYTLGLNNRNIDVAEKMIRAGHAHVFWFENREPELLKKYLGFQADARKADIGIWHSAGFQGALHITSFHANGRGDDAANPNVEYLRLVNIMSSPVNLSRYSLLDCASQKKYRLPRFNLPAGWSVAVRSGIGVNQSNKQKGVLYIHLNSPTELWQDSGAKVILIDDAVYDGSSNIVDFRRSRKDFVCEYPR